MMWLNGSEQDGDVEMDDVWFAYPSRPNNMILKVIVLLDIRWLK